MLLLITYDVSTENNEGKKRLRKISKECQNYGQRVQNSVFECMVNPSQAFNLKNRLLELIDTDQDSLRFYNLGSKYQGKIEHYGIKETYDPEGVLML